MFYFISDTNKNFSSLSDSPIKPRVHLETLSSAIRIKRLCLQSWAVHIQKSDWRVRAVAKMQRPYLGPSQAHMSTMIGLVCCYKNRVAFRLGFYRRQNSCLSCTIPSFFFRGAVWRRPACRCGCRLDQPPGFADGGRPSRG